MSIEFAGRRLAPGHLLAAGCVLYVLLCLAWNWSTPAWEGFDETSHVDYVEHLLETHSLPVLPSNNLEGQQPPGYYLIEVALLKVTGLPLPPKPISAPVVNGPQFSHVGECRLCGGMLTLRLMRLISTALGLLTLLLVYLALSRVFVSTWYAAVATVAVGFIPEFQFVTSIVNNDGLSFAISAAFFFVAVLVVRSRGGERYVALSILMGAVLGLDFWAKEYAFALIPIAPLAILAATRSAKKIVVGGALAAASAVFVMSPLLYRNWHHYRELWPFKVERASIAHDLPPSVVARHPWDPTLWTSMPREMWISFWYSGGWGQIRFPGWVYVVVAVVVVPLLVASAIAILRSRRGAGVVDNVLAAALLMLGPILMYVGAFYSALSIQQFPGRYLFPALGGVAIWLLLGTSLLGGRARRVAALSVPVLFLIFSLAALLLSHRVYAGRFL